MTAKLAAITRDARSLSVDEMLVLAQELVGFALAQSPPAYEAEWTVEVKRRREEVLSGKVKLVPAEEVERSLDRLLKK